MTAYFHIDRWARFVAGQAIDLSKLDLAAALGLKEHCNHLFPDGVSAHGQQYLNLDVKSGNGEAATELIWEYVRRAHFLLGLRDSQRGWRMQPVKCPYWRTP
ncbi:hypothetical protein [Burkholderia multivorans]|uniref:hypothetical protein n=1 Tax=Burkholderiaceae TaxID=119060 RepID=UPI00126A0E8A|nr:hypothetical protein [Burkholderia multivorans]HDR9473292.1 hypothetical protein [Burkholderia multivorans]